LTSTPNGPLTINPEGTVSVAPNTPAGSYTVDYTICEKLNPTNCDTTTVTIVVSAPAIDAVADTNTTAVNGLTGGDAGINVMDNDTLNGLPLNPNDVVLTSTPNGPLTINPDGTVSVAPNTPAGSYTVDYTICEKLNPTNCDTTTVTIVVSAPAVVADSSISITKEGMYTDNNGDGLANIGDTITYVFVVTNTGSTALNNITVTDPNAVVTGGPLATLAAGASDSTTFTAMHTITQADINAGYVYNLATTTASPPTGNPVTGISTDPTPCTTCPVDPVCPSCTITEIAQKPSIAIMKTAVFNDNNGDGYGQVGETITYSFSVMNNGNVPLTNVSITDPLPGIVITGGPISLSIGQTDSGTFVGIYTLTQQDINNGSVMNQAMANGTSPLGVVVHDLSDDDSPLQDDPTVLNLSNCSLKIFNAVSPDGDGLNDFFRIQGIECYPKNTVQIYNRWGVKVYDADGYNNNTIIFRGISEGRVTVSQSEGLPSGTYFYIVKYEDFNGNGIDETGYLTISRD
jgi:gliding motility-associated-like protein